MTPQDTAQAADEQSQRENDDLTEGDVMPDLTWRRKKRGARRAAMCHVTLVGEPRRWEEEQGGLWRVEFCTKSKL